MTAITKKVRQMMEHTSVLLDEAVAALNPQPHKTYVDATLGGGGHTQLLCNQLDASNTVIGIDQDAVALTQAQERLANCTPQLEFIQGNFGSLHSLLITHGHVKIDGGLLLDLGVSDFQIKTPERGFSFQHEGPLDMRMNPSEGEPAEVLVNTMPAKALANLLYRNADEKFSRQLADAIVQNRPINHTKQLAQIAVDIYRQRRQKSYGHQIHPATRLFQALRIAVNQELQVLDSLLLQLPKVLLPGARVAIITFHSLEDRAVKQAFRLAAATCLCPPAQPICTCNTQATFKVIGKPITPSEAEIQRNPQSRSAKLRIAERL